MGRPTNRDPHIEQTRPRSTNQQLQASAGGHTILLTPREQRAPPRPMQHAKRHNLSHRIESMSNAVQNTLSTAGTITHGGQPPTDGDVEQQMRPDTHHRPENSIQPGTAD
ncbi:hypothetical protein CCACVL1_30352 [Corchorus capsularis]|uniref:Uncharacterized protein n=1 Tax=Corchorus capsularis TaxID=210143 RepID=A0A1R3FXN7_COCAP|nr:hypothetical protein CCACVL1_30352 [Corchorus capsularis]